MQAEVTIVIVTFNSLPYLRAAINSITKNTLIPYKLIVVDNGSSGETISFLKNRNILHISNRNNIGYIEAQEQAFGMVDTPYLCSCDDDIMVTNDWLRKLLLKLQADPKVKIVAPVKWSSRLKHPYQARISSREVWEQVKQSYGSKYAHNPEELIKKFTKGKSLEDFATDFKNINVLSDSTVESPPDFVQGCCLLTETKVWQDIGGFVDPDMKTYGTEDVERCWRLGLAGYNVIKTGDVYVHHFEGGSITSNKFNTRKVIIKNNQILLEKRGLVLWDWLRGKLKRQNIDNIIREHWIVGRLLENAANGMIPVDINKIWSAYREKSFR